MTWVHLAFYLGALALTGIWSFCLIIDARNRAPRPPESKSHVHDWAVLEDYGNVRKCRCRKCGKVSLVRAVNLPRPGP